MAQGEKFSLVATGSFGDGLGSKPWRKIFLSYSHEDKPLVERLVRHLRVLAKYKVAAFWWDQDLEGGSSWRSEIGQAIDESSLALVMVSTGLLNSSFVSDYELPRMFSREAHGLRVIPVLLLPCPWQVCPWLLERQIHMEKGEPIGAGTEAEIEAQFARLALKVVEWLSMQPDPDPDPEGDAPAGLPRPGGSGNNSGTPQVANILLAKDRFGWKGLAWALSAYQMLMNATKASPGRFASGRATIYFDNSGSMSSTPTQFIGNGAVTDDIDSLTSFLCRPLYHRCLDLDSVYADDFPYAVYTSGVRVPTCYEGPHKGLRSREAEVEELFMIGANLYQAIFGLHKVGDGFIESLSTHFAGYGLLPPSWRDYVTPLPLADVIYTSGSTGAPSDEPRSSVQYQCAVIGGGNLSEPLDVEMRKYTSCDAGAYCRHYLWDYLVQDEWSGASVKEDEMVARGATHLLLTGGDGGIGVSDFLRRIGLASIKPELKSFVRTCDEWHKRPISRVAEDDKVQKLQSFDSSGSQGGAIDDKPINLPGGNVTTGGAVFSGHFHVPLWDVKTGISVSAGDFSPC